jgi:hypothetical protein
VDDDVDLRRGVDHQVGAAAQDRPQSAALRGDRQRAAGVPLTDRGPVQQPDVVTGHHDVARQPGADLDVPGIAVDHDPVDGAGDHRVAASVAMEKLGHEKRRPAQDEQGQRSQSHDARGGHSARR